MRKLLKKYQKLNYCLSIDDEFDMLSEYVFSTNRLEGNQLSIQQTRQLLKSDMISGEHIRIKDIYEHKGMHLALLRMFKAVRDNEQLSLSLIVELHGLMFQYLWDDDSYYSTAKGKGQKNFSLKSVDNNIVIYTNNEKVKEIKPLSEVSNVHSNLRVLIDTVLNSKESSIKRGSYLAKQIWLHQPFIDGNKRIGRLLINFLMMKEGYPLFAYENSESKRYNELLIQEYLDGKNYLNKFVEIQVCLGLRKRINDIGNIDTIIEKDI